MILPSESFARRSPSYRSKAPSERTRLTKLLSKLAKSRKYFLFSRNSFLNSSRASPAQGIIADRHEDAGRLSTISSRAARDTAACHEARPFSVQYDENVHVLRLLSTDLEHSRAWEGTPEDLTEVRILHVRTGASCCEDRQDIHQGATGIYTAGNALPGCKIKPGANGESLSLLAPYPQGAKKCAKRTIPHPAVHLSLHYNSSPLKSSSSVRESRT